MHILHSLLDPLFAADTDNRADALLDTPRRSNARHADVVLFRDLLDPLDDLLVGRKFALVHECADELVGFGALGRAVGEGTCEGATGNGRPGNEADAGVLTVRNLSKFERSVLTAGIGWIGVRTISRSSSR
jgi:hypothetical protein